MLPFVLLIGLMASPTMGILIAILLAQSPRASQALRTYAWLPIVAGAGTALLAAWALLGQRWEAVIGDWAPVSFTGMPLSLAGFAPTLAILIAWLAVYFRDCLNLTCADPLAHYPGASALTIASLAMVALGNNLITMLVGLGLTDLLTAYLVLRRQIDERNMLIRFVLNGLSISLLLLVVAIHYAAGNSLYLPLVQLSPSTGPVLALAIALRLGFAPFRTSAGYLGDLRASASTVAGLLMLTRLPALGITRLPDWFYALAVLSAVLTLILGLLKAGHAADALLPFVVTASLYLAATSAAVAIPGVTAAAAVAWLLASALLASEPLASQPLERAGNDQSVLDLRIRQVTPALGALGLIGLPPMAGFIGQAGVLAIWAALGPIGAGLIAGWIIALAALCYGLLRVVSDATPHVQQALWLPQGAAWGDPTVLRYGIGGFALAAPLLLFGVAPALLEAGTLPEAVARCTLVGWGMWLVALAIGALAWHTEAHWHPIAQRLAHPLTNLLDLSWLYSLLGGAAARLRSPFNQVFTFLESDGALLWAIIIVLLIVLASRPGGP